MLDTDGFILTKQGRKSLKFSNIPREALKPVEFMTDEELFATHTGDVWIFDVECYVNFFFIAFKHLKSGKFVTFEQSADFQLNSTKLQWMLWRFIIVGFNSINYDLPITTLAFSGACCEKLKEASDFIIQGQATVRIFETTYKVKVPRINHIDIINVAPLQGSLKLYAGRLHCKRMQDLPFPPEHVLTAEDAEIIRLYCCNDLDNTELLFNELTSEIKLRMEMSDEYKIDLRSKSDAQVAEAVINSELQKVLGYYPRKPTISKGTTLKYSVPRFIHFESDVLNNILNIVANAVFELDAQGAPIMPRELDKLKVTIGKSTYELGMGGLHSKEKKIAHIAADDEIIADNDVSRFYPSIILNQGLFPHHLGEAFLTVYQGIVDKRDVAKVEAKKAKANGDKAAAARWKTVDGSLKITINGSFGKLGNKYSTLYAPQLLLQVTITGQLVLLMLIEMLEAIGIDVISGNTDGIVSKYKKGRHEDVRSTIALWESKTNFKTEETRYSAVYSRDVNSYIAVKTEGGDLEARFFDEKLGCKTKGAFSERGSALNSILSKNPETLICTDAVLNYIVNKIPVAETIKQCKDVRRFLAVKNVKGGGEKNGMYLGKVVRWYYPKNEAGYIAYVLSGNKVGKTDGARPLMDLPTEFPDDIDYDYYIEQATDMLYECGCLKKIQTKCLFD